MSHGEASDLQTIVDAFPTRPDAKANCRCLSCTIADFGGTIDRREETGGLRTLKLISSSRRGRLASGLMDRQSESLATTNTNTLRHPPGPEIGRCHQPFLRLLSSRCLFLTIHYTTSSISHSLGTLHYSPCYKRPRSKQSHPACNAPKETKRYHKLQLLRDNARPDSSNSAYGSGRLSQHRQIMLCDSRHQSLRHHTVPR
jgi:hypothetical protein